MGGRTGETVEAGAAFARSVLQTLGQLGIAPLPRNYELLYEALASRQSPLARDLAALGPAPEQRQLDALGKRHRLPAHLALDLDQERHDLARAIGALSAILSETVASKEVFSSRTEAFAARLDDDPVTAMSDFSVDATVLRDSLRSFQVQDQRFSAALLKAVATLGDARLRMAADRRAAMRDGLTGLPNKTAFREQAAALYDPERQGANAALVLVVVERLRSLADMHGKEIAEKALRKIAAIFRKSVKKNDIVARVGPDEFAFICLDVNDQTAQAIATRMRDALQSLRIRLPDREFTTESLSLSAGIATVRSATGVDDLLHQAETALKVVRADGRQGILRCTPMMCAEITRTYSRQTTG